MKTKHAFVGIDGDGDACIYVRWIEGEDSINVPANYLSESELEEIVTEMNEQPGLDEGLKCG